MAARIPAHRRKRDPLARAILAPRIPPPAPPYEDMRFHSTEDLDAYLAQIPVAVRTEVEEDWPSPPVPLPGDEDQDGGWSGAHRRPGRRPCRAGRCPMTQVLHEPGADLCIHDLLAASCIWCTPRPGVVDLGDGLDAPDGRTWSKAASRWLIASFHGRCNGCGEAILPGDTIRREGGHYVCEDCTDA